MKRIVSLVALLPLVLLLTACPALQDTAHDALAFSKGFIEDQQSQHQSCKTDGKPFACTAITQAIAAQSLAVDALEEYCGSAEFAAGTGTCAPNASAAPKLKLALTNLNATVANIKKLVNAQGASNAAPSSH
jgi:hypothetical protein